MRSISATDVPPNFITSRAIERPKVLEITHVSAAPRAGANGAYSYRRGLRPATSLSLDRRHVVISACLLRVSARCAGDPAPSDGHQGFFAIAPLPAALRETMSQSVGTRPAARCRSPG